MEDAGLSRPLCFWLWSVLVSILVVPIFPAFVFHPATVTTLRSTIARKSATVPHHQLQDVIGVTSSNRCRSPAPFVALSTAAAFSAAHAKTKSNDNDDPPSTEMKIASSSVLASPKATLSAERVKKPQQFHPNGRTSRYCRQWEKRYQELVAHQKEQGKKKGDTTVLHVVHREGNPRLSDWLATQRVAFRRGTLSAERLEKLQQLHPSWTTAHSSRYNRLWDQLYQELVAHQKEQEEKKGGGVLHVVNRGENPRLSDWLATQRRSFRRGILSAERLEKLQQLHPNWTTAHSSRHNRDWDKFYQELVAHQKEQEKKKGDTTVLHVVNREENPRLSEWLSNQRVAFRRGNLSGERLGKLQHLHPNWTTARRSQNNRVWDKFYQELVAHQKEQKEKKGDGVLHVVSQKENPRLSAWLSNQRLAFRHGTLSAERLEKLQQLHPNWTMVRSQNNGVWDKFYQELVAHQKEQEKQLDDTTTLHAVNAKVNPRLSIWLSNQRKAFRRGTLLAERLEKLQQLHPNWLTHRRSRRKVWEKFYQELVAHQKEQEKKQEGDTSVFHVVRAEENPRLSAWLSNQRVAFRRGTLSAERLEKLQQLHPNWETAHRSRNNRVWDQLYQELVAHQKEQEKKQQGDTTTLHAVNVKVNPRLSIWLRHQRKAFRRGTLSAERLEKLQQLHPNWMTPRRTKKVWEKSYQELVAHQKEQEKKQQGDTCFLRVVRAEENPRLSAWLSNQRVAFRRGTLSAERLEKLQQLHPNWMTPHSARNNRVWDKFYQELVAHQEEQREKKGDGVVHVVSQKENPRLSAWLRHQRLAFRRGTLAAERLEKLQHLHPNWTMARSQNNGVWDKFYQELVAHQKEEEKQLDDTTTLHGVNAKVNPRLSRYLREQRQAFRRGTLSAERLEKLQQLHPNWMTPRRSTEKVWEKFYRELVAHQKEQEKKQQGDTSVIHVVRAEDNPRLSAWLSNQRVAFRRGTLSAERLEKLQQLHPNWMTAATSRGAWEKFYQELVAHQKGQEKQHGNTTGLHVISSEQNPRLSDWLSNQRGAFRRGTLPAKRLEKLQQLHPQWAQAAKGRVDGRWKETYDALRQRQAEQQNDGKELPYLDVFCDNVEDDDQEAEDLRDWLTRQRHYHRRGVLSEERVEAMYQLHANWTASPFRDYLYQAQWLEKLQRLAEFQPEAGRNESFCHLWVPPRRKDASLLDWIEWQRVCFKKGKLSASRAQALQELNPHWTNFRTWKEEEDEVASDVDEEAENDDDDGVFSEGQEAEGETDDDNEEGGDKGVDAQENE